MTQKPRLWTRDFTIITLGTVVSMLGNAVSGFAISLLVLDYTGSVFLYALYMVVYNLPKVVMPLVAGPYLDSYSRKRAIYTLDFISAGLYAGIFLLLKAGLFSYGPFLALCFFIGCIDSSYEVAYESLYPTLIPEGCFSRAYSISSLIYPFAVIMVPVASFVYERVGLEPLFAFNAATFFVAACFETRIRGGDTHIRTEHGTMLREFREGLAYLKGEPGLMVIAVYFFFSMLVGSGGSGKLGCPAISGRSPVIDPAKCAGCGMCAAVCKWGPYVRGRRNGISEGSQYQIRHACVRPRRAPRDLCDRERPHAGRLGGEAHPRLRLERQGRKDTARAARIPGAAEAARQDQGLHPRRALFDLRRGDAAGLRALRRAAAGPGPGGFEQRDDGGHTLTK